MKEKHPNACQKMFSFQRNLMWHLPQITWATRRKVSNCWRTWSFHIWRRSMTLVYLGIKSRCWFMCLLGKPLKAWRNTLRKMIVISYVPNNMTHYFQPLEITVNVVAKHFLKDKFKLCYANEVKKQLDKGTKVYEIDILLKLSSLKPIHGRWLLGLYDNLQNNTELIINGFESGGITEAVTQELPDEDPVCRFGLGKCFFYIKLTGPFCSFVLNLRLLSGKKSSNVKR